MFRIYGGDKFVHCTIIVRLFIFVCVFTLTCKKKMYVSVYYELHVCVVSVLVLHHCNFFMIRVKVGIRFMIMCTSQLYICLYIHVCYYARM